MNVFGTSVCHLYVHCCSLNTTSSKWMRKIKAGSICDSQTGNPGRYLRLCSHPPRSYGGNELALALGRERYAVGLIDLASHPFVYRRPVSEVMAHATLVARAELHGFVRTKDCFEVVCLYRMRLSNVLKEIGIEYRERKTRSTNREGRQTFCGEFRRIGARDSR